MRQRTKVSHLEALMDIILGADWRSIYELDKDMLGYTIKRKDGKHSGFGGRYSAREMYIYLSGIRDFMVETHQL
jgi:hypothetical protein